jgi:hypothetical protein
MPTGAPALARSGKPRIVAAKGRIANGQRATQEIVNTCRRNCAKAAKYAKSAKRRR